MTALVFYIFSEGLAASLAGAPSDAGDFLQAFNPYRHTFLLYGLPGLLALFLLMAGLVRRGIGRSFQKVSGLDVQTPEKRSAKEKQFSGEVREKIIYRVDKNREKLLYSHLLGVFQRKGRWVDFLSENLNDYEDAQIGAAVRSIHESCSKALKEHVALKPILEAEDGDEITLEEGFSRESIKLIGRVQGKPPFTGRVRHRGWRIEKMDIPEFSSDEMLSILSPAEVEVL
jgi:hypothetical protein